VASRLIFIDKGRIAEDGDPQILVKNPPSPRLREFLQHAPMPPALPSRESRFPESSQPRSPDLIFYTYWFDAMEAVPWILLLLATLLPPRFGRDAARRSGRHSGPVQQ
jgi:ABC-type glutathione transport system ATPase component